MKGQKYPPWDKAILIFMNLEALQIGQTFVLANRIFTVREITPGRLPEAMLFTCETPNEDRLEGVEEHTFGARFVIPDLG